MFKITALTTNIVIPFLILESFDPNVTFNNSKNNTNNAGKKTTEKNFIFTLCTLNEKTI